MQRPCRGAWGLLLLSGSLSWSTASNAEVQTVAVQPAADSYIAANAPGAQPTADANFGTATELWLRGGSRRRALLRFAGFEPSLPPNGFAELVSATVAIRVTAQSWSNPFLGGEVALHRVLEPWTESGVTWNCAHDPLAGTLPPVPGCSPNTWGGGDFNVTAADTFPLNPLTSTVQLDVTSEIQAFLDGQPNDGWLVRLASESALADQVRMASGESVNAPPPSLTVIYDVSVDTDPPVVTLIDPIDGGFDVRGPRPEITFEASDAGIGLDPEVLVVLDEIDISAECAAIPAVQSLAMPAAGASETVRTDVEGTAEAAALGEESTVYACVPPDDLTAGPHTLDITVSDLAGNTATYTGTFVTLLTPGPHLLDLEANADTTLLSDAMHVNRGVHPWVEAQRGPSRRALVDFNRTGLVDLATRTNLVIDDATLEVWVEANSGLTSPMTVAAFRVLVPWQETQATWICPVAAPGGICPNPWSGGKFSETAESSVVVFDGIEGPISWTVTNDLAASLDTGGSASEIFGWALRFDPEPLQTGFNPPRVAVASRESLQNPVPHLGVTFSVPDVDFIPPEVVFLQPGAATTDPAPAVELSFADGESGVDPSTFAIELDGFDFTASCTVQASGAVCTSPALAPGANTYTASLADLAGNVAVAMHEVQLLVPPQIEITQPPPVVLNQEVVTIEASFSDADGDLDPSSVRVILDGTHLTAGCTVDASGALCTSPLLAAGGHHLLVIARDLAGNESAAERLFELTFDGGLPEIAIVAPATWFVLDERPDVEVVYSGTGLDTGTFELRIDGVDRTAECDVGPSAASCEPDTPLAEGLHRVEAEIANAAGNVRRAFADFDLLPGDGSYVRTLSAVADSSIGDVSRGLAIVLEVSPGPGKPERALARFDTGRFGPLAPWIELDAIGLRLTIAEQEGLPGEGRALEVYGLEREWNEVEATFECPADDDPEKAGTQCAEPWEGGLAGSALDTELIDPSSVTADLDLTAAGLDPEGWLVLDADGAFPGGGPIRVGMAAREHGGLNPPQLVVGFTLTGTPDFEPPVLEVVAPVGVVINQPMPDVELAYSDLESGVDPASLSVSVGGVDISSGCAETAPGEATCPVPFALTAGFHVVQAEVSDHAGNPAVASGVFELVLDAEAPSLEVTGPSGTVEGDPTPEIGLAFSDAGTGIDGGSLVVRVDGLDISAACVVAAATAACEPPALGEGDHTVSAEIADLAGNLATDVQTFTVDLDLSDTAPPSLAIAGPAGPVVDDPAPAITVTYSDAETEVAPTSLRIAVDGYELVTRGRCTVGDAAAACIPPPLGAGTHDLTAEIRDLAGNPASAASSFDLSFTGSDTVDPLIEITEPASSPVLDDLTPVIRVEYGDADSGVAILTLAVDVDGLDVSAGCLLEADFALCEPPPLTVGSHAVHASVEDLHGNAGTAMLVFEIDLTVPDATPPVIAIAEPSTTPLDAEVTPIRVTYADGETGIHLSSLTIVLDAVDLTATCDLGPTEAVCTSPAMEEGAHLLEASVEDLAGNPAAASFAFEVVLDPDPPVLTLLEPPAVVEGDPTPDFVVEYSDALSGVDLTTLRVFADNVEVTSCVVEPTLATCEPPLLGDGLHVARVELADVVGNLAVVSRSFDVVLDLGDEVPPALAITAPVDPIVLDDPSPEVRVEYSDGESGVDVTTLLVLVDGESITADCAIGPVEAVCEPFDLPAGEHQVVASVEDLAGNVGSDSLVFEIQLTDPEQDPPLLEIVSPSGTVIDDVNPPILLQYSDAGSGVAVSSLTVEVDGIPVSSSCQTEPSSAQCSSPPVAAGPHQVTATISDLAGNEATDQSSFTVVLTGGDVEPPIVEVESPSALVIGDTALFIVRYSDAGIGVDLSDIALSLDGLQLTSGCSIGLDRAFCDLVMLTEGPHTASASVPDLEGNTTTVDHPFTVDLTPPDTVPPNVAVLEPETVVVDDPQPGIRVEYSDAGSGIDTGTVQVLLDGLDVTAGCTVGAAQTTCVPAALGAGPHTVAASVADLEGNVGGGSLAFELILTPPDLTSPTVEIVAPAVPTVPEAVPVSLELAYGDDGSGIDPASLSVLVDGGDVGPSCQRNAAQATCPLGVLALGPHTVEVEIADLAGNPGVASGGFEVVAETFPPLLDIVTPAEEVVRGDATPEIRIEYSDAVSGIDLATLTAALDGADLLPGCAVEAQSAVCEPPALAPGFYRVSAQIADLRGNVATANLSFEVSLALEIAILSPAPGHLTTDDVIEVSGTVSPETESVTVAETAAVVANGTFMATVPLHEGSNTLTAIARTAGGGIGSATIAVVRDTTAPAVVIQAPPDGFVTTSSQVLVTGEYNESASSGSKISVVAITVNGVPAAVEQRTFALMNHLLQPGLNTIRAEATDEAGNVGSSEITVTLLTNPAQKIDELLGNGQSGIVDETLAQPLLVRLTDGIGNPLPERLVEFAVTRGDGVVRFAGESGRSLLVRTDPLGRAQVDFTLGGRSGMGNHEVTVSSAGFPGSLVFCASAEPKPADRVVRVQGNVQTGTLVGVVGEELPKPLFAQVFDAMSNPVEGAEVTFEVVTGGGSFDGQPTKVVATDATGVATAIFTLGPLPGVDVHVVKATIPQGSNPVASFNVSGLEPGEESMTSVSGLVLDNQDDPVPLATVSIAHTELSTVTDVEGRFHIAGAPVGTIHLVADGRTTPLPGTWAVLEFEMVTVSGRDNDLGMPIRLLPMDDAVLVGGPTDVVIPLDGVPGASLTVFANSATFPGGATEGLVSFTQVHADKVPMVPPLGSVFDVALTIQPPGVRFDPPAQLQIPNPGRRPGEVVDIFSFDHNIGEFVPGGTASVTPDGLYLRSNPGFGVRKAGWHGAAEPVPDTDACNPGSCTFCTTDGPQPDCEECEMCTADGCETPTLESITAVASIVGGGGSPLAGGSRVGSIAAAAAPTEDELIAGKGQPVQLSTRSFRGGCSGTLTYTWTPGDGSGELDGQMVEHVYEDVGTFNAHVLVKCENCPEAGTTSDSVTVRVIRMDLRIHNLPEEDEPEPNEIDPGGVVALNNDDDDEDGTIDRLDSSVYGEDDMVALRLDVDNGVEGTVTLDFEDGADKMKVWDDLGKSMELELPFEWDLDSENVPGIVWIEGVERSESEADVTFLLRYENDDGGEVEDRVNVTVLEVDLDIDSNNDNGFDPPAGSEAEDEIEDVEGDPFQEGKLLVVNHDDDDQDRITDFADGFNSDTAPAATDDDANADEMFVPLVIKLLEPIDADEATVRITYDASDPAAVNVVPVPQDPPTVTLPDYQKAPGNLRLWTVPATARTGSADFRTGTGQFVPSDTYTTAELGFSGTPPQVVLYVESIEGSAGVGDQRILVEVDPDGESGPHDFILEDAVRVTSIKVEVRDTADGNRLIEGGDIAFIDPAPRMPQLTTRFLPADLRLDVVYTCSLQFVYDRSTNNPNVGFNCPTGPDMVDLPGGGGVLTVDPGDLWNVAAEFATLPADRQFFGGEGYIECANGVWSGRHEFRIRGRNPDDVIARNYIDNEIMQHWYAYAISKHESGIPDEIYNQFDFRMRRNGVEVIYTPLLGFPDGRGLFQVDYSADPGRCLTSNQLWNWQQNVVAGEGVLNEKDQFATRFFTSADARHNGTVCGADMFGHPYPHGQSPQAQVAEFLRLNPGTTTATIYGTNPHPCVPGAMANWFGNPPAAPAIVWPVIQNCTFAQIPGVGVDGDFVDAIAIKCNHGCREPYIRWLGPPVDAAPGDWDFDTDSLVPNPPGPPLIIDYVDEVCQQVDP